MSQTGMTSSPGLHLHQESPSVTHCKVKRRNQLGGKVFMPQLHRHHPFSFQENDLYDYDDGYAFLCAKGEFPDGDMGSPIALPSHWSKSSPRASADEMKRFKRNLNVNSNLIEEYKVSGSEPSSPLKTGERTACEGNGKVVLNDTSFAPSREDEYRIEMHAASQSDRTLKTIENVVDYCTCMFCVRGVFYNFVDDEDDCDLNPQSPCNCSDPGVGCTKRWTILALLTCFLPCMLFYPPLRGCLLFCKKCRRRQRAKDGDVTVRMLRNKRTTRKETDV